MRADPAVIYGAAAQKRCLQLAEEVVELIHASPLTPTGFTGKLRAGYRAVATETGAEIVTDVYYWHMVEVGTVKMHAQPHVRPAIEVVRRRHAR